MWVIFEGSRCRKQIKHLQMSQAEYMDNGKSSEQCASGFMERDECINNGSSPARPCPDKDVPRSAHCFDFAVVVALKIH